MNCPQPSETAVELKSAREDLANSFRDLRSQLSRANPEFIDTSRLPRKISEIASRDPLEWDIKLDDLDHDREIGFLGDRLFMRLVEVREDGFMIISCRGLPGMIIPPHYHSTMDEMVLILGGEIRDLNRGLSYRRGESLFFPSRVVHTIYCRVESSWELFFLPRKDTAEEIE